MKKKINSTLLDSFSKADRQAKVFRGGSYDDDFVTSFQFVLFGFGV